MLYITGDIHGAPARIRQLARFCADNQTTGEDVVILLGDVGANTYCDFRDLPVKTQLSRLPATFVCVRGNHEARPADVPAYREKLMFGGTVYQEPDFPNLLFLQDGGEYEILGKRVLAIGGAYSVDKDYRLMRGWQWFPNEQLSAEEQREILEKVRGRAFDLVLTHTCPFSWQPTELFLPTIDQSRVDKSMEIFLGEVESSITYGKWYFGHFHGNKNMGRFEMLFDKIKAIG